MKIYTVYDRPKDCPKEVVVRCFTITNGDVIPDEEILFKHTDIEFIFQLMSKLNLVWIPRDPHDDEKIIGVYL